MRKAIVVLILAAMGFVAASCQPAGPPAAAQPLPDGARSFSRLCGGWRVKITLYAEPAADPDAQAASAFAVADRLADVIDADRPTSEISQLQFGPPRRVSDQLFNLLWQGQTLATRTDGAFDATRGALVAAQRRAESSTSPPAPQQLAAVKASANWQKLKLESIDHTVALELAGMKLHLGQLGTGYAADAVLASLRQAGARRALVEVEQTVAAGEAPPQRDGWRLQTPGETQPQVHMLANSALAWTPEPMPADPSFVLEMSEIAAPFGATVRAPTAAAAGGLAMAAAMAGPDKIDGALRAARASATYRSTPFTPTTRPTTQPTDQPRIPAALRPGARAG